MEKELENLISLIKEAPENDKKLVAKAFEFAQKAHGNQKRLSGEPYFNHAYETAKNLIELGMDATSIAAGFLHDVLEDTKISAEILAKEFGPEILFIVEGVSKLGNLKYHGADRHNESLRKLLLATSKDMRVLVVKLCDRLHNMRTLAFLPEEKRDRIAKETLEIYAPIAYRLGIRKLSRELEDLAFPFVYPEGFSEVNYFLKEGYEDKIENLEKFRKSVAKELAKAGLTDFHSDYRVKGLYSLYKKSLTYKKHKKNIENIMDVLAMRIIVKKTEDCYKALGIIHSNWRPLPGLIKDYIAFPKQNGYQSLHTTIFTGDGDVVEIQIRTEEMHQKAEYGVAAHSIYKAGEKNKKQITPWLEAMLDHSTNEIKKDFLSERIFVFTPKGDVVDLPVGASAIDFAYQIHSDLGDKMSGAKINGKLSAIGSSLKSGDIIEIITSKTGKPNRKWLDFVKTSFAKKHIKNFV